MQSRAQKIGLKIAHGCMDLQVNFTKKKNRKNPKCRRFASTGEHSFGALAAREGGREGGRREVRTFGEVEGVAALGEEGELLDGRGREGACAPGQQVLRHSCKNAAKFGALTARTSLPMEMTKLSHTLSSHRMVTFSNYLNSPKILQRHH